MELLAYRDGLLVERVVGYNLVVNTGRNLGLNQLLGLTSTPVGYMALGSSSTVAQATDSALIAEEPSVGSGGVGVRKALTFGSVSAGSVTATASWTNTENANTTVNELGLFTTVTPGTGIMYARFVLPATVNKDAYTSYIVNYTLTANAAA